MEYVIYLYLLVAADICRHLLLPFVVVSTVLTFGVGGIAALAGGVFWKGAKYAFGACVTLGVLTLVIVTMSVVGHGFN